MLRRRRDASKTLRQVNTGLIGSPKSRVHILGAKIGRLSHDLNVIEEEPCRDRGEGERKDGGKKGR